MKHLKTSVYNRLLAQAEEAKERGMHKLASAILSSVGPLPEDEKVEYSYAQLEEDVYNGMWKLANHVIKYHNVDMVDAEKVHEILESLASRMMDELEEEIAEPSPLEPKVPGES